MTSPDQNYTSWHVGMKVVCQDAEWTRALNTKELEEGRIYTIRWVGPAPDDGIICVRLEEVSRLRKGAADDFYFDLYGEKPFRASRFRPVQTRKTDISCFTAMLSPKPAKAGKVRA